MRILQAQKQTKQKTPHEPVALKAMGFLCPYRGITLGGVGGFNFAGSASGDATWPITRYRKDTVGSSPTPAIHREARMNEYYRQRMEDAPFNSAVVFVCMAGVAVIVVLAAIFNR